MKTSKIVLRIAGLVVVVSVLAACGAAATRLRPKTSPAAAG